MTTPPQTTPRRRPPKQEPPLLLDTGEAARLLGISRSTLYKMWREGRILIIKVSGLARVPRAEVERIAAGRQ